jgi:hypothetical protein
MELAEQAGLSDRLDRHVVFRSERIRSGAANPTPKLPAVIGGLLTGADSIDDLNIIRAGGMKRVFGEVYALATLGILLREFTGDHVRQLHAVLRRHLLALARRTGVFDGIATSPGRWWTSIRRSGLSRDIRTLLLSPSSVIEGASKVSRSD